MSLERGWIREKRKVRSVSNLPAWRRSASMGCDQSVLSRGLLLLCIHLSVSARDAEALRGNDRLVDLAGGRLYRLNGAGTLQPAALEA